MKNDVIQIEDWGVSRGTSHDRQAFELNNNRFWSEHLDSKISFTLYGCRYVLVDCLLCCKIYRAGRWENFEIITLDYNDALYVVNKFVHIDVIRKPTCKKS